jgi:hypothetical protein
VVFLSKQSALSDGKTMKAAACIVISQTSLTFVPLLMHRALVGNFALALDLWVFSPTFDDGNDTTQNSLDNIDLALITDDEMNGFWDTLPREFGGLM